MCATIAVAILLLTTPGRASVVTRLTVTVRDRVASGPVLAQAAVCLNDVVRYTDSTGIATFDGVAAGQHTLSVYKRGFLTSTVGLLFNQYTGPEAARTVLLQPGEGSRPACVLNAPSPPAEPPAPVAPPTSPTSPRLAPPADRIAPVISKFQLNNGAARMNVGEAVNLYFSYTGPTPTEVRVSETSSSFPETWANWQPFVPHPGGPLANGMIYIFYPRANRTFESAGDATKTVYLQVRTADRASAIVTDSIELLAKYVVPGGRVIDEARRQGFGFSNELSSAPCRLVTTNAGNAAEFITPDLLLPAAANCTFNIFSARTLKAPWTFTDWTWSKAGIHSFCTAVVFRQSASATNLYSTVKLGYQLLKPLQAHYSCTFALVDLTLVGPPGAAWWGAFAK